VDKQDLLKLIADAGYNVGFGAKKHFATFDIVDKAPGWIGFFSMAIGVLALFVDFCSGKEMSAFLIILGLAGLYASFYNETKNFYAEKGSALIQLFNELKALYFRVKGMAGGDLTAEEQALADIQARYAASCMSKQIFMSDWYAHYKFFWQHQIDWIDEQKHFKFWRDKVPLSFVLFCVLLIIGVVVAAGHYFLGR